MSQYFGHTHETLPWQTILEHGSEVARLARDNAAFFGEELKAQLAGELHDIGKYGDLFQRRLRGLESGLDHWSAGAHIALFEHRLVDVALAIQGHHIGLKSGAGQSLRELNLAEVAKNHPLGLRLSETDIDLLKARLAADGVRLPSPTTERQPLPSSAGDMLGTRMLFSALVDADFIDTERTMNRGNPKFVPRPSPPALQAPRALALLEDTLTALNANMDIPVKTRALRKTLADACRASASSSSQVFTLTAPTGTGKTLGMLRFALSRAAQNQRIRRIVVVLPFLTILDQTVDIYRQLFAEFGEHYILEHHSLTGIRPEQPVSQLEQQAVSDKQQRLLTENWDAPIIVTTSVQFLESLHANRPSACRKLHNIAGSIVLFDEVQTLPVKLAVPTLKTLAKLATEKYGCSVVFSTATQPAFDTLHSAIAEDESNSAGWQPTEIVADHAALFANAKRVTADWKIAQATPWSEILHWLGADQQALCIVNLKRHALELARLARAQGLEQVYHLSTALCPQHRRDLLARIVAALGAGNPCRVIATQCVEAGVDLDFPKVYRALAPLDAIAQAAGRCNRNNRLTSKGVLTVFVPETERYPTKSYQQATELTRMQLQLGGGQLDLDDPATYRQYFKNLYSISATTDAELEGYILSQNFEKFAERYTLIENDAVNVVVPYNQAARNLMQEARQNGITGDWMRRSRGYTVSAFLNPKKPQPFFLEPVKFRFGTNDGFAETWFLCREPDEYNTATFYDPMFGLLPEEGGL
jgi:CRISPR-associated endonuclease/helicase Cas3